MPSIAGRVEERGDVRGQGETSDATKGKLKLRVRGKGGE